MKNRKLIFKNCLKPLMKTLDKTDKKNSDTYSLLSVSMLLCLFYVVKQFCNTV